MPLPALARSRSVVLPTALGWLVLFAAAGACAWLAALHAYDFLATTEPAGARLLVVEGWLAQPELDQAIALVQTGAYERVVTTGGPITNEFDRCEAANYADRARGYLLRHGLAADAVVSVPAPASAQDRSFLSAVMVREWAARAGGAPDALDVFSSGVHSRRSRAVYRLAFGPGVRVGIYAATPGRPDPKAWWRTSAGVKEVPSEAVAWLWTALFFRPGERGSHDEMWGVVPDSGAR